MDIEPVTEGESVGDTLGVMDRLRDSTCDDVDVCDELEVDDADPA